MESIYELIAWSIDFEGCITIHKREYKSGIYGFNIKVSIANSSEELLKSFQNKIKIGKVNGPYIDRNRIKNKKLYRWDLNKKEIKEYLPLILPYLHLKWRQAELIIEASSLIKNKESCNKLTRQEKKELYTWEEFIILESCYNECKKLNEKGEYNVCDT